MECPSCEGHGADLAGDPCPKCDGTGQVSRHGDEGDPDAQAKYERDEVDL